MAGQPHARSCRRIASLVAFLGVTGLAPVGVAAPDAASGNAPPESVEGYFSALVLGIQKTKLDNGLKVVLNVERGAPVIAVSLTLGTGRAHGASLPELVDALRHQRALGGSTDHDLVRERGGASYQSAGWEHSTFTEVLPADELPFALWLEGQRLRALAQIPDSTRSLAAASDRAFSLLEPERRALFELERAAWAPAPGEKLGAQFLNDCCFTPQDAVLTLTGDFDSDSALRLLGEHLAEASRAPTPAATSTFDLAHAVPAAGPAPELSVGFVVPGADNAGYAAVILAAELLAREDAGSLGPVFGAARSHTTRVELGEARGRSLLAIHFSRRTPGRETLTPKAVFGALARAARQPLNENDLARLRKVAQVRWLTQFASLKQKSELFGRYEVLHGDARLSARRASDLAGVTPQDVGRVLATLTADRAIVAQGGTTRKADP